jgi:hypothetical protein
VSKPKKETELIFRAVDEKGNIILDSTNGVTSPNRRVLATGFRAFGEPPSPNSSRLSKSPTVPNLTSPNPNPAKVSAP